MKNKQQYHHRKILARVFSASPDWWRPGVPVRRQEICLVNTTEPKERGCVQGNQARSGGSSTENPMQQLPSPPALHSANRPPSPASSFHATKHHLPHCLNNRLVYRPFLPTRLCLCFTGGATFPGGVGKTCRFCPLPSLAPHIELMFTTFLLIS